jgi:hypothetical protein
MRATRLEMREYRAFDDDSDDDRDSLAAASGARSASAHAISSAAAASHAGDDDNDDNGNDDPSDTPYHPVYMTAEYLRRAARGVALARLTQLTIDATAAAGVSFSADGRQQHTRETQPHGRGDEQQRSHSGGELRDDKIVTLENLELCPRLQVSIREWRTYSAMVCFLSVFLHSLLLFAPRCFHATAASRP